MNILLLFADQMRFDCLGSVNPAIRTPNLDRLARRGMLAHRAYAPTPVCLPCRAALLTGQYTSTNRAMHNMAHLPQDHYPTIPQVLARRGYYTHMIGKSHLNPCHDPASPEGMPGMFNYDYYRAWRGPWYGFDHAEIAIGHSTEKHACGMHYGAWLADHGVDVSRHFGNTAYTDYGAWDLPEEFHNSAWAAERTIAAIRDAGEEGRPFFIWSNFQDPHNPCMVPEPWASMYDPDAIPTFGFKPGEPDCFDTKPPLYRDLMQQPGEYACKPSDPGLKVAGNVSHFEWTPRQIQENAACYYGMVSLMDKYIGRILDALDESQQADDTLVVFTADHGDLLGDHGLWWKSLVPYDESIRVPFIASLPGRIPAGAQTGAIQNLVDLFPTFCDFAGVTPPLELEGVSQRASWQDPSVKVRQDTIVEERPGNGDWNQRILVEDQWRLAFYAGREYGELYHTADDPHLCRNLWDQPDQQPRKMRMIARILSCEVNKRPPTPRHTDLYRRR